MYHRFSTAYIDDPRFVDPVVLAKQLQYICDHYTVIEPKQHLETLAGRRPGHCPVTVTVDDGYADFHDVAFPLFSKYDIPAMLFVATGFVAGDTWFWWDKLAYLIRETSRGEHRVKLGSQTLCLDLVNEDGRAGSWHRIADRCRFMADEEKEALLADLASQLAVALPSAPPPDFAPVTWDEIRNMMHSGIRFGAHTVSHPILSRVPAAAAAREMSESRLRLEAELGIPVKLFAYPQGGPADFNQEIKEIAAGEFDGSYVAYQDMDNRGDHFVLPRYCVSDDMTIFRWVLCGAEFLGLQVRKILGLRTGVADSYWSGFEEEEGMHE
jgi:peptidoglycan/xylan/chitin deacetylase (PgdA/CDA1 family)